MTRIITFIAALAPLAAIASPSQDLAHHCVPYEPRQCLCWTSPDKIGEHCIVRAPVPQGCEPCLNGCDSRGECIDAPFADEDGFPIVTPGECSIVELDGIVLGACTGYGWTCDAEWCSDTNGMHWRTPATPIEEPSWGSDDEAERGR